MRVRIAHARWCATAIFLFGLLSSALPDPPGPATRPADSPPLVGLRCHHAVVVQAVRSIEQSQTTEAIARLKAALSAASNGPRAELNELRLGLGMILLRAGDLSAARKTLLPLSQLKDHSDACSRAEVLCGIASRAGKPKTGTAALLTREAWRSALVNAMDDLAAQMTARHRAISAAIASHHWADVHRELGAIQDIRDRSSVFDLEDLRLRQADLIADHARALAGEVRDVNVVIAQLIHQASDLAGQMTMKQDSNSKRRGYVPADIVNRHNAVIDDLMAANVAGEKLVTEYGKAIGETGGRVKRDTSVKMSKTRLPAKRPVFGR